MKDRHRPLTARRQTDWDPVQQHAIANITDCQIQMVAHRKAAHVLPTLVVSVSPDPVTDKLRKRRSSRTAGLTSTKETTPTTLWFRPGGDDQHGLPEWARYIQSLMQPSPSAPVTPATPASPTFANPFSPRAWESSDFHQRPGSGNPTSRITLSHKTSAQTQSSRERETRPVTYSESPSLRSRRSDLSHNSGRNPHAVFGTTNNFSMPFPADLPSPATTVAEYQGEFIEGWTSAQGRSSTLSSPIRGRDSLGSQPPVPPQPQPTMNSSSPPNHRETILDRAFHLRCIPGSEDEVPGEEKLTSLARFDALMRLADEKRGGEAGSGSPDNSPKSGWDLDDDSDSCDDDDGDDGSEDGGEEGGGRRGSRAAHEAEADDSVHMPRTAQRALDFIAARHEPAKEVRRPAVLADPGTFNLETLRQLNSGSSHLRPYTGYRSQRPAVAQRVHSQPQLAPISPVSSALDVPSSSSAKTSEDGSSSLRNAEKRLSTSSTKRLSFTEFTKRLSTSSLLLVQANGGSGGGGGGRGSGELEVSQYAQLLRGPHRGAASPASAEADKRCGGWRGSVGVFGAAEGGFL